ncbi:helix-turn-helix domain-containing protein [Streptomyces collinus]|uniref:helix-turn-helix domain-containing protein n=1 Tax=Streptomyces collinus TaxID=42684 RepID=UPI0037FF4364
MTTAANLAQKINRQQRTRRRQQGVSGLVAGPLVAAHLQACIDAGWTRREIAAVTHVSERGIRYILGGQPTVQHDNAQRLLAVRPEHSPRVPPIGCIRRIRALSRAGYTVEWTGQQAGCSHRHIYEILNGTVELVDRSLAERFAEIYRRHEGTPGPSNPARIAAKSKGWHGPEAWDPDTIDDPDAAPEWTGACGSDRGWWMHTLNDIPVCPRCEAAHVAWLAERKDLPAKERWRQLALAKGAASSRGANLAADARELMRISGLNHEQAAERLGVTRQHLYQELTRHPEDMEVAA